MIRIEDYTKMLSDELEILRDQVADLTHEDSLLQPQPGGNCLNWVMGHLVGNLVEIQNLLGGEEPKDIPDLGHYGFGSDPICGEEDGVIPLQVLMDTYAQLTKMITDRLATMSEADFDEEVDFWQGKTRRGYVAFFYFFHNTYHIGQLEQLRNLAGRTEKVI